MKDLTIAKKLMESCNLSLVVVKNELTIFQSGDDGIKPFFEALITDKENLKGACVADKVVGLSLAHLLMYAKINKVYAELISSAALNFLTANGIEAHYKIMVPFILNKTKDNLCVFEEMAQNFISCEDAFNKINKFLLNAG